MVNYTCHLEALEENRPGVTIMGKRLWANSFTCLNQENKISAIKQIWESNEVIHVQLPGAKNKVNTH